MFASYGRYWAETFWLRPHRIAGLVSKSTVDNEKGLRAAFDEGRGVLLILPHMGNWEVAGAVARDLGMPVLSAAENLPNPLITKWFLDVRRMAGIDIVLTGRGARATVSLLQRLEEGGTVALLAGGADRPCRQDGGARSGCRFLLRGGRWPQVRRV
jgi:KDO2-lipid IV(A) lauroyltransferase